ncbi:hypothetical protein NEUTE2DRAFT_62649 [Neurospora tetrasperma FGSC 2509]|nr:hypothetical protein NEUTE2DRAFT_62649 [Neurospora tetrasperma FGSC 2509]
MSNTNTNNHNQLPAMPVNAGLDNDNGRVSNEDIRKYVADSAQQMSFRCLFPQEVHDRMWQLFKMAVRFTQREMEQDLSFAPLAVAREFLKKERHAYALDREKWATEERIMGLRRQELAIERQCIAAEKAKIVAAQRKLAAERLQFEAKKNIIRAGQKVPGLITRRPAMIPIQEQQREPLTIATSKEKDHSGTREPQIRSKHEDTPDTALSRNLKRSRSDMEAAPDKTSNTLQQVRHSEPTKPAPINITLLEGCVRTTAKVVDLLILKQPHDIVSRPKQRDPNVSAPLITSIISSLFAKGNEHRLRNWRAFELCVPTRHGCIWVCKDGRTGLLSFVWREVWEKMEGGHRERCQVVG